MSIGSSRATTQAARRSVEQGPRRRGCDRGGVHGHADSIRRAWPAAGSHLRPRAQALLRPPRALLAATRRDGALSNGLRPLRTHWGKERTRSRSDRAGAHLVVGNPCNIDILLRTILLKLHPTSPPSHTCLYMK